MKAGIGNGTVLDLMGLEACCVHIFSSAIAKLCAQTQVRVCFWNYVAWLLFSCDESRMKINHSLAA